MGALGKGELDRIFLVGLSTPVVALVKLETVKELLGNGSSLLPDTMSTYVMCDCYNGVEHPKKVSKVSETDMGNNVRNNQAPECDDSQSADPTVGQGSQGCGYGSPS